MSRESEERPVNGDDLEASLDAELGRVLEAYLADLEAGRPDDRERLLAEHPAIARQLRACLQVMNLADRMAGSSGSGSRAARMMPGLDSTMTLQGQSVLAASVSGSTSIPRVQLRDLPDEPEPLIKPRSAEMPGQSGASLGRYQVQGEIARGGMGAILNGRDVDLGRELALKVLLESHQGNPEVVSRFIEEAQIGGQLQHPGIAPVYELGTFPEPDRRPYFAMKLVKGQTLAALLSERGLAPRARSPHPNPPPQRGEGARNSSPLVGEDTGGGAGLASDLPRVLSIFEQICQTMAYAHARGVIHRDLKPSNIMVGSFGEVQVMDWGLAKVLPRGGIADEAGPRPARETVIMTLRSGSAGSGSDSQAGSVLGTPAYMAPEQARGEVDRIDEQADVFGLGAILCGILTGRPPFAGETREEVRAQSARGDLGDALARLAACSAEAELIELARECLAPERARRPRSAGHVSRRMTAFLTGLQERLRAAELAWVEAQARAGEERKRRRLTVALAASVLVVVGLLGGGSTYLARQRMARLAATTRVVTEALAEAERLRGQAQAAVNDNHVKWFEAVVAATRARDLLAEGEADQALRQQVNGMLAGLVREQAAAQKQAAEAERDRKLLGELESIRGRGGDYWDPKQTAADYAAAFRAIGIDLDKLDPEEAATQIAGRSAPVELASYLDNWALRRRQAGETKGGSSWRRVLSAARAADPDPWRVALRDQLVRDDLEAVRRLAGDEKELEAQAPISLVLLAAALNDRGDSVLAERVLRRAWRIRPDDFWVNHGLGLVLWTGSSFSRPEEAARFHSAAVAIRPRSSMAHANLGVALAAQGKLDEAIAEYRTALRIRPDYDIAHNNLADALHRQGKLDEAIGELRTALRLNPDYATAHNNLGGALFEQGKLEEAIAQFRTAIRLKPDFAGPHHNLGTALGNQGKLEEAVTEYRTALHLNPDYASAHNGLGKALKDRGKVDEAVAEYRAALRLKPDFPEAHCNLGNLLRQEGRFAEALAELRRGHELGSKNPNWHRPSAQLLHEAERLVELDKRLPAILTAQAKPADSAESLGFAQLCYDKKLHGTSARFWAETFQAEPKLADDMEAGNRYNAACAAALAGWGQGKDDPPLDEPAKARWRNQAIDWLKADLAAWSNVLEKGPSAARQSVSQTLQRWKADPDLAGLRDAPALAKLPEAEQKACRALWAEVDALLKNAQDAKP